MAKTYDVAVIGGGINGAAIACYAARRGLSVVLVEKGRCGYQTTAGSSRLIHGGIRYLSHNTKTTVASCLDSGLIVKMAPHLVERQPYLLPIFHDEHWKLGFAESYLELYDHYQELKGGKPHVRLSRSDVRGLIPEISPDIVAGLTFDEWLVEPVLLVREHVDAAQRFGATVREETEVTEVIRRDGHYVLVVRGSNGETERFESLFVVNATGPWVDRTAALFGATVRLRPTKGVHLVLDGHASAFGVVAKLRASGDRLFITPLSDGTTLVGPTDDDVVDRNPDALTVTREDREALIEAVEVVLPGVVGRYPIVRETVALRALPDEPGPPSKISRDFQIVVHDDDGIAGAVSVYSGKMSEYHLMAARVVEYLGRFLLGNRWTPGLYAYRLPNLTDLSLSSEKREIFSELIHDFEPTAQRGLRQAEAIAKLAGASVGHVLKKTKEHRRGLAVFYETYGHPISSLLTSFSSDDAIDPSALRELTEIVGERRCAVSSDEVDLHDQWPRRYLETAHASSVIVSPGMRSEVARVLRCASAHGIAVVPRGAGSGVCGGIVSPATPAVVLDTSRVQGFGIDRERMTVTVGAGIIGADLEAQLNAYDPPLTLGHFPASIAISTVGGWLGTRSSGQESTKYGSIDDMLVELEMAFPDGSIHTIPAEEARKFVGSEGTLGVFTRATFRLHEAPESWRYRAYRFEHFADGVAAMAEVIRAGFRPNILRLYDGLDARLTLGSSHESRGTEHDIEMSKMRMLRHAKQAHRAVRIAERVGSLRSVLILAIGDNQIETEAQFRSVKRILLRNGSEDLGEKLAHRWRDNRFALNTNLLEKIFANGAFVNTLEFWAPWHALVDLTRNIEEAVSPYALPMAHVSHCTEKGACLYITYLGAERRLGMNRHLYDAARDAALGAAVAEGVKITHHHGIGLEKKRFFAASDPDRVRELQTLKRLYDPHNIMNPGKLFD